MNRRSVTRLPALPGLAAWNAILGPAPVYAPVAEARTADVVVVGAGFAGLTAARRLHQIDRGARILVLEAGPSPKALPGATRAS